MPWIAGVFTPLRTVAISSTTAPVPSTFVSAQLSHNFKDICSLERLAKAEDLDADHVACPQSPQTHRDALMNSPRSSVLKAKAKQAILNALHAFGHRSILHRHDRFGVD